MKKIIILILISFLSAQRIDCVGNSITANGYPEITDFWMVQDGYEWRVYNYGVPGITVSIDGFDYISTPQYQEVMERKSDHIVVMLGANDRQIVALNGNYDFEQDYRLLINMFRGISKQVFLGTLTYQIYSGQNATIDVMNTLIKKIAQEYGLKVIDFNSALGVDANNFQADGVHPTTDGKYKLARLAFDVLRAYPIYCNDISWQPDPTTIEKGVSFIQTSNCGNTRISTGTKVSELGVDDEYWDAVDDYDNQKPSLLNSCSMRTK